MANTDTTRETWCPDAARYDRGECGWPQCGCPDNGPTDAEVKSQTTVDDLRREMAELVAAIKEDDDWPRDHWPTGRWPMVHAIAKRIETMKENQHGQ